MRTLSTAHFHFRYFSRARAVGSSRYGNGSSSNNYTPAKQSGLHADDSRARTHFICLGDCSSVIHRAGGIDSLLRRRRWRRRLLSWPCYSWPTSAMHEHTYECFRAFKASKHTTNMTSAFCATHTQTRARAQVGAMCALWLSRSSFCSCKSIKQVVQVTSTQSNECGRRLSRARARDERFVALWARLARASHGQVADLHT